MYKLFIFLVISLILGFFVVIVLVIESDFNKLIKVDFKL